MGSFEKIIQNILSGRKISFRDEQKILFTLGFTVKASGSHYIFRRPNTQYHISLKKRTELLAYQMRLLQEVLINHGYKKNR